MFVCLSVILSTGRCPMWSLPMIHWTSLDSPSPSPGTSLTWDLTVQGYLPQPPPLDMGPHCTVPPSSDIWWSRLETCSNLFTWRPQPPVLTSGDYWTTYGWLKQALLILLESCPVLFYSWWREVRKQNNQCFGRNIYQAESIVRSQRTPQTIWVSCTNKEEYG